MNHGPRPAVLEQGPCSAQAGNGIACGTKHGTAHPTSSRPGGRRQRRDTLLSCGGRPSCCAADAPPRGRAAICRRAHRAGAPQGVRSGEAAGRADRTCRSQHTSFDKGTDRSPLCGPAGSRKSWRWAGFLARRFVAYRATAPGLVAVEADAARGTPVEPTCIRAEAAAMV